MKTIAVLTDFSKRAENAARYACGLAQHLSAGIVLYNAYLQPSSEFLGAPVAWPMENYDQIERDSKKELEALAEKLKKKFPETVITYQSENGNLFTHLDELILKEDITLLVMGSHEGGFAKSMLENHVEEIIENITLPVLIIPEGVKFEKYHKLTFATDFSPSDLDVIQSLKGLAQPFEAEILLAHISEDPADAKTAKAVKDFLAEITEKMDYPHIFYREVISNHVKKGLDWLTGHVVFDMLIMVHRDKGYLSQIFNRNNTERIAAEIKLPLLVYPGAAVNNPVF
jgi:nucleotide-binding universal stress UspA family protein